MKLYFILITILLCEHTYANNAGKKKKALDSFTTHSVICNYNSQSANSGYVQSSHDLNDLVKNKRRMKQNSLVLGDEDIRPYEIKMMNEKKALFKKWGNNLIQMQKESGDSYVYVISYIEYFNELKTTTSLKWWDESDFVDIPNPPLPSAAAIENMRKYLADEEQKIKDEEQKEREHNIKLAETYLKLYEITQNNYYQERNLELKERKYWEDLRHNKAIEDSLNNLIYLNNNYIQNRYDLRAIINFW